MRHLSDFRKINRKQIKWSNCATLRISTPAMHLSLTVCRLPPLCARQPALVCMPRAASGVNALFLFACVTHPGTSLSAPRAASTRCPAQPCLSGSRIYGALSDSWAGHAKCRTGEALRRMAGVTSCRSSAACLWPLYISTSWCVSVVFLGLSLRVAEDWHSRASPGPHSFASRAVCLPRRPASTVQVRVTVPEAVRGRGSNEAHRHNGSECSSTWRLGGLSGRLRGQARQQSAR